MNDINPTAMVPEQIIAVLEKLGDSWQEWASKLPTDPTFNAVYDRPFNLVEYKTQAFWFSGVLYSREPEACPDHSPCKWQEIENIGPWLRKNPPALDMGKRVLALMEVCKGKPFPHRPWEKFLMLIGVIDPRRLPPAVSGVETIKTYRPLDPDEARLVGDALKDYAMGEEVVKAYATLLHDYVL